MHLTLQPELGDQQAQKSAALLDNSGDVVDLSGVCRCQV
jgi:hypothetical protein